MLTITFNDDAHDTRDAVMKRLEGFRMEVEHTTHPGVTRTEDLFFIGQGVDGEWNFHTVREPDGMPSDVIAVVAQGDLVAVKVL